MANSRPFKEDYPSENDDSNALEHETYPYLYYLDGNSFNELYSPFSQQSVQDLYFYISNLILACIEITNCEFKGPEIIADTTQSHRKDNSFCNKCNRSYANERGLNQHFGKKHSKRRKYHKCFICSKRFFTKYILKTHIKNVHHNIAPSSKN